MSVRELASRPSLWTRAQKAFVLQDSCGVSIDVETYSVVDRLREHFAEIEEELSARVSVRYRG